MANVQDSQLLLINPSSRMNITRSFDESIFNDEFVYTVPVIAWFNDAQTNKTFQIAVNDEEGVSEATPQCLPMFLLASLFLFAIKQ
jgi:hypothetical protein